MKVTYDRNVKTRRDYDADVKLPREVREFNHRDRLGRLIGARADRSTVSYVDLTEAELETRRCWNCIPAGTYFAFQPSALRNGRHYGASQREQLFTTEAEREAAVAKYFRDAEKRAAKRAGR